jgi:hypothetical protein
MKSCFSELAVDIFPFNQSVEFLLNNDWPENRMDKLHSIEHLNPDLISFFQDHGVKLRDTFLMINWWTLRDRPPHTDGNWFSNDKIIQKRQCGINWNFTPGTWVEFYSMDNATPNFDPKGRIDDATTWSNVTTIIDKWDTPGPVIFNPQIIHRVKSFPHIERRASCTLRFGETYESLCDKLSKYLK